MERTVFFISDGTGITAEAIGNSLISQFEGIHFTAQTLPYIDTIEKARLAVEQIERQAKQDGVKPLVFTTLVNPEIRATLSTCSGRVLDLFQAFLEPIETELQTKSSYTVGRSHSVGNPKMYHDRIDAINYALANDDGLGTHNYKKADIVIIGVSRSGKTPTSLYLALQFGVLTANYPLTEDDIQHHDLPEILKGFKQKLFGLTINASRLQEIRNERRPNSRYASLQQCQLEVKIVEQIYERYNIPYLDTTTHSIEEIATKILAQTGIQRKVY